MGKELLGKSPQAEEMVTNRDVDKTPGRATRVDGPVTPAVSFMSPKERDEKVRQLENRITDASANCNVAIEAVKIHTLLKKQDDVPWFVGLLLDVAFTSLSTWASKALTKLKAGKIASYSKAAGDAAFHGDSRALDLAEDRKGLYEFVSDESIKARIANIGGLGKNQARSFVAETVAQSEEKAESYNYLEQLQISMGKAFQRLREHGTQGLSDAELDVFFEAMEYGHHSTPFYIRAITAKLDRYKKSGIDTIGKMRTVGGIDDPQRRHESIGDIEHETRVVWTEYPDKSKALWYYEKAESHSNARAHELALSRGMDGTFRLTKIVPKEFWEEAVGRCEETTGKPVQTLVDSPETRTALGLPGDHKANMDRARISSANQGDQAQNRGTIRGAANRLFGGK